MNRGFTSQNTNSNPEPGHSAQTPAPAGKKGRGKSGSFVNLKKLGSLGFLLALLIIVASVVFALIGFKGTNTESRLVDAKRYQAVFLNGGQVYFGNIKELNNKYLRVNNIYYLRVNQQVQPDANAAQNANDVSLVKLGCELHGPQDAMVINRDQIVFWENLKDDGQVLKAIGEYKKQFPNGEDCSKQASSTGTPTNSTGTNPSTKPTTTTPSTTTGR